MYGILGCIVSSAAKGKAQMDVFGSLLCSVPQNRDLGVRTEGPLGGPPSPVFGKDWSGFTASLFVFVILGIMSIYLDNLRVHIFVLFWGCILILSAFWDIYTGLSCQRVSGFLKDFLLKIQ